MSQNLIFLVDQDGPLAEFETKWLREWRRLHPDKPHVAWEDRRTWSLEDQYDPEYHDALNAIMDEPGFFRDLPLVPGAAEGINMLNAMFPGQVFICTSPMKSNPTCASDKQAWVAEHLGRDWVKKMIITSDKTVVRGNFLIDDKADITGFAEPEWEHILFTTPINAHLTDRRRVSTWLDVINLFSEARIP